MERIVPEVPQVDIPLEMPRIDFPEIGETTPHPAPISPEATTEREGRRPAGFQP